jgi:hypothetical protein
MLAALRSNCLALILGGRCLDHSDKKRNPIATDAGTREAIERLLNAAGLTAAVCASAEEVLAVGPVGDDAAPSRTKLPQ